MNQEDNFPNQNEEIDLMEWIRVLVKRKNLILDFFLAGLVLAVFLTFFLPPKYIGQTVIEIGKIQEKLIEEPIQLMEQIKIGAYGNYPGIEINNPIGTNLLKIKIVSRGPEEARKGLESLNQSILDEHNSRITSETDFQKSQIDLQKSQIEKEKEIYTERIEDLKKDIYFLMSKNQQIAGLQLEIYRLQSEINDLQKQIENIQLINQPDKIIQATKIIQEPVVSEKKPNLILNLIFGGALGIFLGLVFAFTKDWWEKNKIRM